MGSTVLMEWTALGEGEEGEALSSGGPWPVIEPLQVELRGTYTDGTFGVTALSSTVSVDGTPPEITEVLVTAEEVECAELSEAIRPASTLRIRATDTESGVVAMRFLPEGSEEPISIADLELVAGGLQGTLEFGGPAIQDFTVAVENGGSHR